MFSKDKIINYLKTKKQATFINIVKALNISPIYNKKFSWFLNDLRKNGDIAFSKRNDTYLIPEFIGNFDVEYKLNNKGNGFSFINIGESASDIKVVFFDNRLNALKNDLINVNIFYNHVSDFYFAVQIKMKERKNKYLYAKIDENLNLSPIWFDLTSPLKYDRTHLKPNTYSKFEIKEVRQDEIVLEFVEVLNSIDEPYSDINLFIDNAPVQKSFSNGALLEAQDIPDEVENEKAFNRVDLLEKLIVTIDGEKTKDFDDAISVEKTSNNTYILGVHIADVAYYIKENSHLDLEARERGTSIYLIDLVIPMLPEKLSNGICSLNPNQKRFTLTLEAEIDFNGNVLSKKIYPSLIESNYRLTYNQVANMKNDALIQQDQSLKQMLEWAYELSSIIGQNKINDGYIDFEIEEPTITLDPKTGKAIEIKKHTRLSSEILIENFMVFANESVSEIISNLKIPSIYRIHEAPSEEKINALKSFIKMLNISDVGLKVSPSPKDFQHVINNIKEKRFDNLIKMFLLRTMQKAKYSTNNIGHFGLASKFYSHFTSPIRRYPDLLLHRIIWEVMFKQNPRYSIEHHNQIEAIAKHSSEAEVKAADLENKVKDMKKAEFYESLVNSEKDATIISIHKFGFFVDFDYSTNALVHISTLYSSYNYEVSDDYCKLIIKDDNKTYVIGQKVKVKIVSVSKLDGKINAILV